MRELADTLTSFSDRELDARMFPLIRKWDEEPTALQILEVLDACIYGALASGFVVASLQLLYDAACKREGRTHEQVIADATWRKP